MQVKFLTSCQTGDLRVGSKGQVSLNFNYKVKFSKIFIQIRDIRYIEQNFHSVALVMPQE